MVIGVFVVVTGGDVVSGAIGYSHTSHFLSLLVSAWILTFVLCPQAHSNQWFIESNFAVDP